MPFAECSKGHLARGMPYNYDFTSAEFNTPNTTITHPTTGAVINTTYNPDSQYIKDIKLLYPGRREYDYANEFWNEFVTGAQNKDIYI